MSAAEAPLARIGRRLGLTEGQVYTAAIGLTVGLVAAFSGIPPTLVAKPGADVAAPPPQMGAPLAEAPAQEPATFELPTELALAPEQPSFSPAPYYAPPPPAGGPMPPAAAPVRATPGSVTTFARVPAPGAPEGVAVLPDGRLFAATNNGGDRGVAGPPAIVEFAADGDLVRTHSLPGVDTSGGHGLLGLAAHGGVLYALSATPAAVWRLDPSGGAAAQIAVIPDLPSCLPAGLTGACELSPLDRPPLPKGLAAGPDGTLYIADANQATVWRLAPGQAAATVLHQAPGYVGEQGPSGVAVEATGALIVTVARATLQGDAGAVYRLARGEDGAVTEAAQIATTASGELPTAVAAGASGHLYVALSGANAILALKPDGTVAARYPEEAAPLFATPSGVALHDGGLFVANQAPGEPDRWAVLRVELGDRPAV